MVASIASAETARESSGPAPVVLDVPPWSVTFNCGASPTTITVTGTKSISADTTIDGGNLITISGGNRVGVFSDGEREDATA